MRHMSAISTSHFKTSTLAVMTVTTGLVVANMYYNQPLLGDIANTYHISSGKAGQVSMITQIGYAVGMLLIAPLADMYKRKKLMLYNFWLVIAALVAAGAAPNIHILMIASFFIGAFSLIPQLLVAMTAHLAHPAERGKKIGVVMTGLLTGILLSRTVSGFIGAHYGWRAVFYIAAGIMVVMWLIMIFTIPEVEPDYKGNYKSLMISLYHLVKNEPALRIASARGALCFACFSAFWTTLTFLLKQNFNEGSDIAGLFGLVGAFGAIAAGFMGRLSDRTDAFKLTAFTIFLILVSYIIFIVSAYSIPGLVVGVILLDVGMQATHISNQSLIYALNPDARNRINTIYMVSYFCGGAIGAYFASHVWNTWQWNGVCAIGIISSIIALVVHLVNRKKIQQQRSTV